MTAAPTMLTRLDDGGRAVTAIAAVVRRVLRTSGTAMLVQVKAVTPGGTGIAGTVDVQPMVHQQDGAGRTTPHGIIHGLPYFRLQGGTNAVILDPAIGDIGVAVVASRDITKVKANRAPSPPDSFRMLDAADGLYLGGFLGAAPAQFVEFTAAGVVITSTGTITLNAPGGVVVNGAVMATGDVKAGAISLEQHVHGGVTTGTGDTGLPIG